jgi:hypothetical protein
MLVDHVGNPNQSPLLGMNGEETIKNVVGNIDATIRVPTRKVNVSGIQDGLWESEPLHLPCLFLPKTLP